MKSYESTGRTVEEAINAGLEKLGLSIGEVTVDIVEEGSKGLFGLFGSRQSKVRLTVKEEEASDTQSIFADSLAPRRQVQPQVSRTAARAQTKTEKKDEIKRTDSKPVPKPQAKPEPRAQERPAPRPRPAPQGEDAAPRAVRPAGEQQNAAPAQPVTPAPAAQSGTLAAEAQNFLLEITRLMGVPVSVAVSTDEEGNIHAAMQGDALGVLIGRRGETLDALQYLAGLQLNRGKENYTRITLDSEGYRAKREEALIRLANRMANRAQKTGRRVAMEPMNPYERRILHSALQNHPGVATHSEGEEPNRHVVITLNREGAAAGQPTSQDE